MVMLTVEGGTLDDSKYRPPGGMLCGNPVQTRKKWVSWPSLTLALQPCCILQLFAKDVLTIHQVLQSPL